MLPASGLLVQAALNEKMAEFTANAKQFTMDGGIVYDFKDEDDYRTAKKDLSHLKKAMASNWVEQQPRQRKMRINYNEAEFLKASMKAAAKEERQKGPRLAKMPQLNDFQFFDTKRIEELYAIEHAHETWKYNQMHRRHELEKSNATPEAIEKELAACASEHVSLEATVQAAALHSSDRASCQDSAALASPPRLQTNGMLILLC
jgi:hypothetical protein